LYKIDRALLLVLTFAGVRRRDLERKEGTMCANCGCGIPEDAHNDDRNILWSEIVASAEAVGIPPGDAVRNIVEMAKQHGQEV
jgi:hypothetical protein